MRILFVGDVVGRPGRRAAASLIPQLREEQNLDLIIVNAENSAAGRGIQRDSARQLFEGGADVLTGGNHFFDKADGIEVIDKEPRIVRPHNLPPGTPGRGLGLYEIGDDTVAIINLLGRVYMNPVECPFRTMDRIIDSLGDRARIVIVDFHAEATAEKIAMGWYLDGRVSAVLGTHTHVATADERVLPQGTAYITDVGMTGPHDSVIGVRKEQAIQRMVSALPVRFQVADNDLLLNGVVVEIDPASGRAERIERIRREWKGEA